MFQLLYQRSLKVSLRMRRRELQKFDDIAVFEDPRGVILQFSHRWRENWRVENGALEESASDLALSSPFGPPFAYAYGQKPDILHKRGEADVLSDWTPTHADLEGYVMPSQPPSPLADGNPTSAPWQTLDEDTAATLRAITALLTCQVDACRLLGLLPLGYYGEDCDFEEFWPMLKDPCKSMGQAVRGFVAEVDERLETLSALADALNPPPPPEPEPKQMLGMSDLMRKKDVAEHIAGQFRCCRSTCTEGATDARKLARWTKKPNKLLLERLRYQASTLEVVGRYRPSVLRSASRGPTNWHTPQAHRSTA